MSQENQKRCLMQTSEGEGGGGGGVGSKRGFIMRFVRVVNIVFEWGACGTPTFCRVISTKAPF